MNYISQSKLKEIKFDEALVINITHKDGSNREGGY